MKMKKLILALFLFPLVLSCVRQMEEMESTRIAGTWAVVDENDIASRFFVFDNGYLHEYKSVNGYFVRDQILWGTERLPFNGGDEYRYSFQDGVMHYRNYYKDVHTALVLEGNAMRLGEDRCLRIRETDKSFYSTIVLSEANKLNFHAGGEEVEWDFIIENPVDGFELVVAEAPVWCGGAEGVRVEDGKICFSVPPGTETLEGKFVFSYLSAEDVVVDVKMSAPEIILDETSGILAYNQVSYSFGYKIKNRIEGVQVEIEYDADWITAVEDDGSSITYSVTTNASGAYRSARIALIYSGIRAEYEIGQEYARTKVMLDKPSEIVKFNAAAYSFVYEIIDELEWVQLQIEVDSDWITDVKDNGEVITYSVTENNSGSARTGRIKLTYGSSTRIFAITQSYSRGYSSWIGDWTFTGADGFAQTVTFLPRVADKSFSMIGFLGLPADKSIAVQWDEENQVWNIASQYLGRLTVPSGWEGYAWLYGAGDGKYITKTDIPICTGGIYKDGSYVAVACEEFIPEPYNYLFKPTTMIVIAEKSYDNQVYVYREDTLNFPFTITRAGE